MTDGGTDRRLLDRELLLASAGSGKTFQLSSRLIGLLAAGAKPEEILASTFTRKAAGEILERVLVRLARAALDESEAEKVAGSVPADVPRERLTSERCGEILVRTLGDLHRLQVHTLDAFFHKVVRAFSLELGLPGEWTVADEPTSERLRSRALEEALRNGDRAALIELVRAAGRGDADRSVHGLLTEQVEALHDLYREGAEIDGQFWGGPPGPPEPPDADVETLLRRFAGIELPLTGSGEPNRTWVNNHEEVLRAVEDRDWAAFLDVTLVCRVLEGAEKFSRIEIGPDVREPLQELIDVAAARLHRDLRARVQVLGRFLPRYHEGLVRLQFSRGVFGFKDLTYALAGLGRLGSPDAVHYRLDGRIRHVLLDEFQDTSIAQWTALEPLVGEILSGYAGERAAFVVADPKQSIYGWRDGEPRILNRIQADYGIEPSTMSRSWRSSSRVLELVNQVFRGIAENPVLTHDPVVQEIARRWSSSFEDHLPAGEDLPGYVCLETGPDPAEASGESLLGRAATRVMEIHRRLPGASIGILTRKNKTVAELIARLREMGVEASEEGGVPVADSAPVVAVLALLRLADHPEDRISRYLVARTPLGPLVGLEDWQSLERAQELSRTVRERLLGEGYGRVLAGWVRGLDPLVGPRDRDRLRKLLELAFRWDDRAGLRPTDFVRTAEASRAEGVGESPVRIMTVYRAKGLEFDVVVLPELDGSFYTPGKLPSFLPERSDRGAGSVQRILPGVKAGWEPLFPELREAAAQHRESRIRDSLSALYVALTRARFATHLIVGPDPRGTSQARSDARLVREALLPLMGTPEAPADTVLWEFGEREWWSEEGAPSRIHRGVSSTLPSSPPTDLGLAPSSGVRLLPRRTPSELEGGERVSLADVLRPRPRGALERGSLIHAWLEEVEWLDESGVGAGVPGSDRTGSDPSSDAGSEVSAPGGGLPATGSAEEARLVELARAVAPGIEDPAAVLGELRAWVEAPEIRTLLLRSSYPSGTTVERELPFLARDRDGILQGVADRLHRLPDPQGDRLVVIDWKTDRIQGDDALLEARAAHYAPQIEAYCRALARLEGVGEERVEGVLAFLQAGRAIRPRPSFLREPPRARQGDRADPEDPGSGAGPPPVP